jgi:hypothetical protein
MVEMTAEQATEWGKTLTFEQVWAAIMRTDKQIAETRELVASTFAEARE